MSIPGLKSPPRAEGIIDTLSKSYFVKSLGTWQELSIRKNCNDRIWWAGGIIFRVFKHLGWKFFI